MAMGWCGKEQHVFRYGLPWDIPHHSPYHCSWHASHRAVCCTTPQRCMTVHISFVAAHILLLTDQTQTCSALATSEVPHMDTGTKCEQQSWNAPNTCTLVCQAGYTPSGNPQCTAPDTWTAVTCDGTSSHVCRGCLTPMQCMRM